MGITLKQLTDTVAQVRDYVLHKTHKINQINYAQKTVNTELDSCFCKLASNYTPVVGEYLPFVKASGSFEVKNGRIVVKPGQRVQINLGISYTNTSNTNFANIYYAIKDYTNDIYINPAHPYNNAMYEFSHAYSVQYTNETDKDCEIGVQVQDIYSIDVLHSNLTTLTVQEISRQIVIDPLEYVNVHQGIEDAPVGSIISHAGNTAPRHYLICDGTEYNIVDYPYLAQHISDNYGLVNYFGGDGTNTFAVPFKKNEYTDITPTMTADTVPVPYVVTASSYIDGQNCYKAFNGTVDSPSDCWASKTVNGWLKIDFGKSVVVSKFAITGIEVNVNYNPKDFKLYGSNDDIEYKELYNATNQINWKSEEKREYDLGTIVKYRYFKLEVLSNNGQPYSAISLLHFYSMFECNCIKYEPTYFMEIQRNNTNYLSPTLYSQEERIVGCWINGKPLYEKTMVVNSPSSSSRTKIADIPDNVDDIFIKTCYAQKEGYSFNLLWSGENGKGENDCIFISLSEGIVLHPTGNTLINAKCYIVLCYTKTTDAENSFTDDMIQDYIVNGGDNSDGVGSGGTGPSYGPGGSGVSCNCPSYTNEEVDAAIDEILNDDIIEEENIPAVIPELYPEMDDTPTVIPELYEEDIPTIIPEIPEETVEPEETPTNENIEE